MSTYKTWNDFFYRKQDNAVIRSAHTNPLADVDDLENRYRKKHGLWLDHHAMRLTKKYGAEKAWEIIGRNIAALEEEKRHSAERAAELEKKKYDFHAVPDGVEIPF